MHKVLKLIAIVLITSLNISCSKAKDELAMSRAPETPSPQTQKDTSSDAEIEKEIKVGSNISKEISEIKVKTLKNKTKDLEDFMGPEKTLFFVVKPGCIFCESLIAVLKSSKPKVKAKQVMVLDQAHADFEAFKAKAKSGEGIEAEWIYDFNNAFHDKLHAKSFPRLIVVDSQGSIIENQVGLVVPENRDQLEGKAMPEVLQILSVETVKWLESL